MLLSVEIPNQHRNGCSGIQFFNVPLYYCVTMLTVMWITKVCFKESRFFTLSSKRRLAPPSNHPSSAPCYPSVHVARLSFLFPIAATSPCHYSLLQGIPFESPEVAIEGDILDRGSSGVPDSVTGTPARTITPSVSVTKKRLLWCRNSGTTQHRPWSFQPRWADQTTH
ncbi:uncharacterized protein LOC130932778 [Arachis stenosperma]|uniref:uncharacterized protein LOC130932778 n=1 Tax=Arachis stenosperma TaxID=217475 RepID=UPI0025AC4F81|nr:uncharacterized protein LOC130932778 [Arachis stenosperma]